MMTNHYHQLWKYEKGLPITGRKRITNHCTVLQSQNSRQKICSCSYKLLLVNTLNIFFFFCRNRYLLYLHSISDCVSELFCSVEACSLCSECCGHWYRYTDDASVSAIIVTRVWATECLHLNGRWVLHGYFWDSRSIIALQKPWKQLMHGIWQKEYSSYRKSFISKKLSDLAYK